MLSLDRGLLIGASGNRIMARMHNNSGDVRVQEIGYHLGTENMDWKSWGASGKGAKGKGMIPY